MTPPKMKGLGRGLEAIFASEDIAQNTVKPTQKAMEPTGEIETAKISPNPKQPRTTFEDAALKELADSISVLGVIQPITVRPEGEGYVIISGERRWRAAQLAGLETVPVYIRQVDDQTLHEMALVENIQRQDLNAMEVAISLKRLMEECDLTQDTLSGRVGKKRSTIANYLRLLHLPDELQLAVKEGLISMGHAKSIASLPEKKQIALLKRVIKNGLSVRQLEALVAALERTPAKAAAATDEFPESYSRLIESLERVFGSGISIKTSAKGRSKIVIELDGGADIDKLVKKLG